MGIGRRDLLRAGAAIGGSAAAAHMLGNRRAQAAVISPAECPIENIVVLLMENRSFDHMLGRLPGVDGLTREMHNLDTEGNPVYAHRAKDMMITIGDPHHGREESVAQYKEGTNGGFVADSGSQTMTYMSPREIPWMYAAASEYVTFDHWHCSILGPTWPNRSHFHAGTSGGRTANEFSKGKFGLTERTIWHQLSGAGIDWAVYFTDVPFTALYFDVALRWSSRFKTMNRFYADAAAGRLPPVVHLEPGYVVGTDDHPPANAQAGQRLMHDVVNALQNSPQWPQTALVITYDEHGGFFDHVPPPTMPDDRGLGSPIGFRVPSMLISPWARRGYVAGETHDHTSALAFIQWRFGLPPLTVRNEAATSILYAFDFSQMRTDLPSFPVPDVDDSLIALAQFNRIVGPADPINLPGGEAPEPETLWSAEAAVTELSAARTPRPDAPLPPPPELLPLPVAQAAAGTERGRLVGGQPELEEAADAGVIPDTLDARPVPGRIPDSPFMHPDQAAAHAAEGPAWREKTVTATRLPRPRSRRGPQRY